MTSTLFRIFLSLKENVGYIFKVMIEANIWEIIYVDLCAERVSLAV